MACNFAGIYFQFDCTDSCQIFTECYHCNKESVPILGSDEVGWGGAPTPETFFPNFVYFARYDRKNELWRPRKFYWGRHPLPGKYSPPIFFAVRSQELPDNTANRHLQAVWHQIWPIFWSPKMPFAMGKWAFAWGLWGAKFFPYYQFTAALS